MATTLEEFEVDEVDEVSEVYEGPEVPEGKEEQEAPEEPKEQEGPEETDGSEEPEEPEETEARAVSSLMEDSVQVAASVGWTPMAAESMGWLPASLTAERLEGRLRPGIRIWVKPARAARSKTAGRSGSKFSKSKWQCVSVRFKCQVARCQVRRNLISKMPEHLTHLIQSGDLQPILEDCLDLVGVHGLAIDAHNRLGAGEADEHPAAIFQLELESVDRDEFQHF